MLLKKLLVLNLSNDSFQKITKKNKLIKFQKQIIDFSLILKYKFYFYLIKNQLIKKVGVIRNVLKIKFTKSNIFPSILAEINPNKIYRNKRNKLLFTISLGTFRKLTKYLGWKKKNTNYIVMLSLLLVNILKKSSYNCYTLFIKNIKKTFFSLLINLQYLDFKYLTVKDNSYFTIIKVKKKTNIKRRLSRKMTYLCPLKV